MAYVICHSKGSNSPLLGTATTTILTSKPPKSLFKVQKARQTSLTIHSATNLFDNIPAISGVYSEKIT